MSPPKKKGWLKYANDNEKARNATRFTVFKWLKIFDHTLNTTLRDRLKANVNAKIKSKKVITRFPCTTH